MLDRGNARAYRDFDPFSAMRVRCDFAFQLARLIDHRFKLFKRVLRRANGVAFR